MTPDRASHLLHASEGRRLLLIGDLMMDEWVFGTVRRISPEAPIPVVAMPLTRDARADKPGGAGNVAAVLLGLGASVRVFGLVGDDDLGRRLLADLAARGADCSGVVTDPSRPTTHKMRVIAARQQLLRIDTESSDPLSPSLARRLRDLLANAIGDADVILAADYAKGVLSQASLPTDLVLAARDRGIPFCADPKPVNIDLFRGASLVSPNEAEALEAAAINGSPPVSPPAAGPPAPASLPPAVLLAGRALRDRLRADAVFITRGEHGIAVFSAEGGVADVPASTESGSVGDGTGCGDAVIATSALALAAGATYLEAAELANAAGGVVSRFVGVHSPQPGEILDWLARGAADHHKRDWPA